MACWLASFGLVLFRPGSLCFHGLPLRCDMCCPPQRSALPGPVLCTSCAMSKADSFLILSSPPQYSVKRQLTSTSGREAPSSRVQGIRSSDQEKARSGADSRGAHSLVNTAEVTQRPQ